MGPIEENSFCCHGIWGSAVTHCHQDDGLLDFFCSCRDDCICSTQGEKLAPWLLQMKTCEAGKRECCRLTRSFGQIICPGSVSSPNCEFIRLSHAGHCFSTRVDCAATSSLSLWREHQLRLRCTTAELSCRHMTHIKKKKPSVTPTAPASGTHAR